MNSPLSSFYRLQSCRPMSKDIFRESLVPRKQIKWKSKVRSLLAFLYKFTKSRSKLDQLVKSSYLTPKYLPLPLSKHIAPSSLNVGFLHRKLQNLGKTKHHLFHKRVRRGMTTTLLLNNNNNNNNNNNTVYFLYCTV